MANLESISIGSGGGKPEELPVAPDNIEETATGVRVKPEESEAVPPKETAEEKPEWLEGFDSPEALAKAYKELRGKMSKEGAPPRDFTPETAAAAVEAAGLDMSAMEQEYAEQGKLSDATLASLEAKGLSREAVDKYIAGQEAVAQQFRTDVAKIAGSEEQLKSVIAWAGEALSDSEAQAYNAALDRGDVATTKLLLQGIVARYTAENGSDPVLLTGNQPPRSGAKPFGSTAEIAAAFNDKRYKEGDKAYQKQVAERMAVTENL